MPQTPYATRRMNSDTITAHLHINCFNRDYTQSKDVQRSICYTTFPTFASTRTFLFYRGLRRISRYTVVQRVLYKLISISKKNLTLTRRICVDIPRVHDITNIKFK